MIKWTKLKTGSKRDLIKPPKIGSLLRPPSIDESIPEFFFPDDSLLSEEDSELDALVEAAVVEVVLSFSSSFIILFI